VILETDSVFGWRNITLGSELEGEFSVPVYLDNDVKLAALAELNSGWGRSREDFVLMRWGTGIGAGIVIGGKLYHGAHWAAGEIGHMLLNIDTQPQVPNPRGYLESVVGTDRVAARWKQERPTRTATRLADHEVLMSLKLLAEKGDSRAATLLENVVRHIASAIANLSAAYDPEVIVLLGEPFLPLLDQVKKDAAKLVPWTLEIRPSQIGEGASLQGAIAAALNTAYEEISRSFDTDSTDQSFDVPLRYLRADANG
jgi:glucokinase